MKAGTHNHIKTKRLKKLLGVPLYQTVGVLECLWLMCIDCCDEGNVGKFSDQEIADYLEWDGDASHLVRCLSQSGWIDVSDHDRLVVHDWIEHCPEYIRERVRKRKMRDRKQHGIRTYVSNGRDNGGHNRTKPDKHGTSSGLSGNVPSIPNPTQPNPTNHSSAANGGMNDGMNEASWNSVCDRLGALGLGGWQKIADAAKGNGCDPAHVNAIIDHGLSTQKNIQQIGHRIKIARMTLAVDGSWPTPKVSKKSATAPTPQQVEDDLRFKINYEGRQAGKSRQEIDAELSAAGIKP